MDVHKNRTPARAGQGFGKAQNVGDGLHKHYNPLAAAAAKTLAREISIIMLAGDRMAAGYGLDWSDFDRLHTAHQHVIRVLADMTGKEVLQ